MYGGPMYPGAYVPPPRGRVPGGPGAPVHMAPGMDVGRRRARGAAGSRRTAAGRGAAAATGGKAATGRGAAASRVAVVHRAP